MKQQTGGQLGSKDRQPTCVVWIWVEILWFSSISLTSRPTSNCTEQRRFIASYSQPTTSSVRLASKCSTGPGQPGHWAIECINNKFSYNKSLKFSLRMSSPFIYTWNAKILIRSDCEHSAQSMLLLPLIHTLVFVYPVHRLQSKRNANLRSSIVRFQN